MSDKTDELLRALRNYDTTKRAHDEAMAQCDCSWGYRGHSYITALERAEGDFAKALEDVIDERISLKIANMNGPNQ